MTLRKLSAAVLASVVASGAVAQTSDSLDVTLNVAEVNEVLFEDASVAFSAATSGSTASSNLCVFSNANDYELTVSTTNNFQIINGNGTLVAYNLTIGGTAANSGTVASTGLTLSGDQCTVTPSYDNAVVATLGANVTEAGSYSDTILVSIASI